MGKRRLENNLDKKGLPTRGGVYLAIGVFESEEAREIDVYEHKIKGLCCFSGDYGGEARLGANDDTDCHVSVQCTGLEFIKRVRDLN